VAQRVRGASEQAGVEQTGRVVGCDRPVGDTTGRRFDLDQHLEPEQAARAVAHDADVELAFGGFVAQGAGDTVGAPPPARPNRGGRTR